MPVIGLNFTRMSGKKGTANAIGEIKVNYAPKFTEVKEVPLSRLNKKALSISFEFFAEYDPAVGEVQLEGNILYLAPKNQPLIAQWEKEKRLPDDLTVEVLNHLFRRCLVKIASIADDLQLPPPIQIPLVQATPANKPQ